MNALENFHRMLEGKDPERLPFDLPVTPPVEAEIRKRTGKPPEEAFDLDYRRAGAVFRGDNPESWRAAFEQIGFHLPENGEIGYMGITHLRPPSSTLGDAWHLMEMVHPLERIETVEQLTRLPWPDTADPVNYVDLPRLCAGFHAQGKVAVGCLECTTFEHTWYLRGMDNVFCDWAEDNPVSAWLLDFFTERSINATRNFVRAGFDMISLGDDVGMQNRLLMSADTWREHLKPRLRQVVDAIRKASEGRKVWVQYHSDGDVTALVDDLIEVGIDILNPVQPECMDLEAVSAQFAPRLAFSGMIGTQTTMPFGSPDDVRTAVARCRALHHRDGARVIVAPTHVLEPDVPWENIVAFIEAVRANL